MSVAKIAAVNWVLLTKLVMRALPFHCTTEPETKFVPVTVSVNAVPPGVALEGESKAAVGAGLLIAMVRAPDVPPPGEGLTTVIESVPAVAMSLAEIAAVNWVLLTKLVARALPFHCTTELETKFAPVTVSVNVAPPAVALEGESKVAVGAGLLMAKVRAPDVPPPGEGFSTVTETVPAVAMSPAEIAAVNWVLLTKLVARALPFHCTTEPESKFVPVTVSMNAAPPAVVLVSESEVAVGAGLLMAKVRAPDVAPPGEGFATVTEAVPAAATSLAKIAAVNWVLLTKVVTRALPFHCTVAPETKFVPFTVRVNAAPPAVALEGESEVAAGTGLAGTIDSRSASSNW
jgi:branched-subunit amino acid transport protein AzlD